MITALIVFIAVALVVWVALPFLKQPAAPAYATPKTMPPAEVRRQLRDLEFDRATGKVDENDYAAMKAVKQQELNVSGAPSTTAKPAAPQVAQPPQPHAQYLQSRRAAALAEAEIAIARARLRLKNTSWQCAQCGHKMSGDSQFCSSCGTPRVVPDAASPASQT